jgi:aminoglycoside phosphotransferase (APT) family kinase protein
MTRRDSTRIAEALLPWLREKMPGVEIDLPAPSRPSAGASSETYLLTPRIVQNGREHLHRMVLRMQPSNAQIYENPSVAREHQVIALLGSDGSAPVPKALWLEEDPAILGSPFFIMEHVDGRIPGRHHHSEGYLAEIGPAEREAVWTSAIEAMAKIHSADTASLAFLGPPSGGVEAELARWQSFMFWSQIPVRQAQERALRWLTDNRPHSDGTGLAWGDARPENMIFREHRCVAVIDWETVSLGGAESDLGWWLFWDWMVSEGSGVPRLEGLAGRQETLSLWETFAGRKLQDMEWHEVFATWRFGMIADRALMLSWNRGVPGSPPPGAPSRYIDRLVQLVGS